STLYLAALRVYLNEDHGGGGAKKSRTLGSAKNLSLASLQSCEECREAIAFHVRVGDGTPRSLWAPRRSDERPPVTPSSTSNQREPPVNKRCPVDPGGSHCCDRPRFEPAPSSKLERATLDNRVPSVKIAKVTWDKPSAQELHYFPLEDPRGEHKEDSYYYGNTDNFPRMHQLKEITFGKSFNNALGDVHWPAGLERLTFGHGFSQQCVDTKWPECLSEITFGHEFNHPIEPVRWPRSLTRLSFGYKFNQPVDGGGIRWPVSLKALSFGWKFNQCLRGVEFPKGLEALTIAGVYDKPIDEVQLPRGLKNLVLGGHFNQSLEFVRWPTNLEELTLGWAFDQPLLRVRWPPALKRLALGYRLNQPRGLVKWPEKLEELELGVFSRLSLEGMVWPLSLKKLTVSRAFDTAGLVLPEGARLCRRGQSHCEAQRVTRH
ncbi:unnamed protein product, partial [Laminaria digitata]